MQNRITCLVAEPEPEAMRQIDVLARQIGAIDIRWKTRSLESGVELVRKHRPEMAIVGLDPDPAAAIARIAEFSAEFPSLCVVALSARSDADLILRAMRAGAHDFLRKPATEADLRAAVEK
ncbi:MAG TPA: response regulator, partial [Candidatus Deferrimicrobiaceae bacterium]